MLQEHEEPVTPTALVDARRELEVYGWRPRRESWDGNLLDRRRSVLDAIEHVVAMDGSAWREALVEVAVRIGWLPAGLALFVFSDLEAAIEGWENAPDRTLADVLRVLS